MWVLIAAGRAYNLALASEMVVEYQKESKRYRLNIEVPGTEYPVVTFYEGNEADCVGYHTEILEAFANGDSTYHLLPQKPKPKKKAATKKRS